MSDAQVKMYEIYRVVRRLDNGDLVSPLATGVWRITHEQENWQDFPVPIFAFRSANAATTWLRANWGVTTPRGEPLPGWEELEIWRGVTTHYSDVGDCVSMGLDERQFTALALAYWQNEIKSRSRMYDAGFYVYTPRDTILAFDLFLENKMIDTPTIRGVLSVVHRMMRMGRPIIRGR